jgi:hypothetical protein
MPFAMTSVHVVNAGVCNHELSSPVYENTRDAHHLVKCGALRPCSALLWEDFEVDMQSVFLNLPPGLGSARLNRQTTHLRHILDLIYKIILCCIAESNQPVYFSEHCMNIAARLVLWPLAHDVITV